jgi:hypothetical protein
MRTSISYGLRGQYLRGVDRVASAWFNVENVAQELPHLRIPCRAGNPSLRYIPIASPSQFPGSPWPPENDDAQPIKPLLLC